MLGKHAKQLKLVIKNYPLPMHQHARRAATAALAANRQGKFPEFSHKLFEASNSLSSDKIQEIAKGLGLNMETFNKDLNDPAIQSIINRDMKEGEQAEVQGTPTVFVNGKLVQLRSLQDVDQAIEMEIQKKK